MNRFDIADAHCLLESDYNVGGILHERPSNQRRNASTGVQLHRMGYWAPMDLSFESLEDDGKEVYLTNVLKWGLPRDAQQNERIREYFAEDWLQKNYPEVARECLSSASKAPRP